LAQYSQNRTSIETLPYEQAEQAAIFNP